MKTAAALLVAALVLAPSLVRAEGVENAKNAVVSVINLAEENAKHLAAVPVEFANYVPVFPYGTEYDLAKKNVKTLSDGILVVKEKAAYWEAVAKTLAAERERQEKEIAQYKGNDVGAKVRAAIKTGRLARAAADISDDAKKDVAFYEKSKESNQQLLDRKKKLASEIKGYKDAVAP